MGQALYQLSYTVVVYRYQSKLEGVVMRKVLFAITHLVPRSHWTTYTETATGVRRLTMWRQWGTRCWDVTDVAVSS